MKQRSLTKQQMRKKGREFKDHNKDPNLHTGIFSSEELDRSSRSRWCKVRRWKLIRTQDFTRPPWTIPPSNPHDRSHSIINRTRSRTPHSLYNLFSLHLSKPFSLSHPPTPPPLVPVNQHASNINSTSGEEEWGPENDPTVRKDGGSTKIKTDYD